MINELTIEICIDSVASAVAAQAGGAQRVELCDNLLEGGTTPSAGMIALVRREINIELNVIIRPRGGDFCFSDVEFEVMQHDIKTAKELGANGVVIGILTPDGNIDKERSLRLVELARPLNVTFHRAFDMTCDPFQALEDLIDLNVDRVLTSGQDISVLEGLDTITELVKRADDRIIIMPGGGLTERNVQKIVQQSGVREIHFSGRSRHDSPMAYRNTNTFMGGTFRPPEFTLAITNADRVRAYRQAAEG